MSIIDQICDIELQLVQIREEGDKEVLQLQEKLKQKSKDLHEEFAKELSIEKKQLEQEMLERVKEYTEKLIINTADIKKELELHFNQNKTNIVQQVCKSFWKG